MSLERTIAIYLKFQTDRALVILSGCSAQTLTVGMHAEVCEPKERHCLISEMQEDFAYQVDRQMNAVAIKSSATS